MASQTGTFSLIINTCIMNDKPERGSLLRHRIR